MFPGGLNCLTEALRNDNVPHSMETKPILSPIPRPFTRPEILLGIAGCLAITGLVVLVQSPLLVAAALLATKLNWVQPPVTLTTAGGDQLIVELDPLTLTGPAEHSFRGTINH